MSNAKNSNHAGIVLSWLTSHLTSEQQPLHRATLIHDEEKGNACTRLVKAIEFHPNIKVIPETRISVLSCIQTQPLSPQGDFFRAIKFNNHGNFLYPPSSSAATTYSPLTNETCPEKLTVMPSRGLHPLKGPDQGNGGTFMSSFLEGRFPEESAGL